MVDLETFSTDSNAVVVTAAFVEFEPTTSKVIDERTYVFDIMEQLLQGRSLDTEIVKWWSNRPTPVKNSLWKEYSNRPKKSNTEVIQEIDSFLCNPSNKTPLLWSYDCSFTNVVLRSLYKETKAYGPLPSSSDRDVKTLIGVAGNEVVTRRLGVVIGDCVRHFPLHNYKQQIKACKIAYDIIRENNGIITY